MKTKLPILLIALMTIVFGCSNVDPQFKKVEIYVLMEGKYQPAVIPLSNAEFTLKDGCHFSIDLEKIWE